MEQYLPFIVAGAILLVLLVTLVGVRVGGRRAEAPRVEAPPAPKAPEKAPPVGLLARGLAKSRRQLADRLSALTGKPRLEQEDWDQIEDALIRADVGVKATVTIVERLKESTFAPDELKPRLARELESILETGSRDFRFASDPPSVWLVAGVNGTGKTTTIAKLAKRLKTEGKTVVLAAGDTFRAAAIDQLGTWAQRVGVNMVKHAPGADPSAVVFDAIEHAKARSVDVVIVDTAGRLQTKTNLMEELKKIHRVASRQGDHVSEVLLIIDATVGQNGISQAKAFKEATDVTGVILTKLDGTARGGIVVAIQEELGIPVKAVGVGESAEDLELFEPDKFVGALLED